MQRKVALIGRPNVGKSALFNRICQKRHSIVDEEEGITRDRLYQEVECFGQFFTLIDTGGIQAPYLPFEKEVALQAELAIEEADVLVFVVDGRVGVTELDQQVAQKLRRTEKPVILVVNKTDSDRQQEGVRVFYSLGIPKVMGVSAIQGTHIAELLETILELLPPQEDATPQRAPQTRVALVGRANVGKSTLLNGLTHEQRAIISPIPGTTRDAIDVPFTFEGKEYLLVDTAGIRRKKGEKEVVDKFAAIRTEKAVERCDVCLFVLDAVDGLTTQERRIAQEIDSLGKSCILLFNKWDLVKNFRMEHAQRVVQEHLPFLSHCPILFISAQKGRNLDKILPLVEKVYEERSKRISTGSLNQFIEKCLQKYHPPLITGKRLRIYYMTQVEANPPKFVLFINRPDLLTDSYQKYLVNQLRKVYGFSGCPLRLETRGKKPPPASQPRLL